MPIDLELRSGECLALLGENGAGKTTLTSILFGHYVADAGRVLVADPEGRLQPLTAGSPHAALAAGVGMVHQHFTLATTLSALDNIVLGTEPLWRWRRRRRAARRKVERLIAASGLEVSLDAAVATLSIGERQRVEILKALYRDVRVLILDEPTAVLTPQEAESLFQTLDGLTRSGLAVLFISHKLDEVMRLCRRVAVLRAGRKVAEFPVQGTSPAAIAEAMVGRAVSLPRRDAQLPGAAGTGAARCGRQAWHDRRRPRRPCARDRRYRRRVGQRPTGVGRSAGREQCAVGRRGSAARAAMAGRWRARRLASGRRSNSGGPPGRRDGGGPVDRPKSGFGELPRPRPAAVGPRAPRSRRGARPRSDRDLRRALRGPRPAGRPALRRQHSEAAAGPGTGAPAPTCSWPTSRPAASTSVPSRSSMAGCWRHADAVLASSSSPRIWTSCCGCPTGSR